MSDKQPITEFDLCEMLCFLWQEIDETQYRFDQRTLDIVEHAQNVCGPLGLYSKA